MDNYPKTVRRIMKSVEPALFYKVAQTRPEIFEVLTAYEFDDFQTQQIVEAFANGLSLEKIKSCATPDFGADLMMYIYTAYKNHLTVEQMRVALNPAFSIGQYVWILKGILNGWAENKIKLYAKKYFDISQMEEIYTAIEVGISIRKIKLFAKRKFSDSQMRVLRLAFSSFESELTYDQVKVIAKHEFNTEQMNVLLDAYNWGLTIEQVREIAKVEYSFEQMKEIIKGYLSDYSDDEMALLLNSELNSEQISAVCDAIEMGLAKSEIETFASSAYNSIHMRTIAEAYNCGCEYVHLLLDPNLDDRQVYAIGKCYEYGLTIEQVEFLAKAENNYLKMHELARWFLDGFSIEQIQEYSSKFSAEQMEKIRYGLKNKIQYMDLYTKTEFDECQMQEIISGIESGFTREQLLVYADPKNSAHRMSIIRKDIEVGLSIEKVMRYAKCIYKDVFDNERRDVWDEEIQKLIK